MKSEKISKDEKMLIYSTKSETQKKDHPLRIVFRVFLITLLFAFCFVSYLHVFSGKTYLTFQNRVYKGMINADNFYQTKDLDLIVANTQFEFETLEEGDEIFYSSASSTGSAIFKGLDEHVVELENEDHQIFTINKSCVVGKVCEKKHVVGFFFGFVQSYAGAITFSLLIFVYMAILSLSRINYENTSQGKKLLRAFMQEKKKMREFRKVLKEMKDVNSVFESIDKMLLGVEKENQKNFEEFEKERFKNLSLKYKYVLFFVHENLMQKEAFAKEENKQISSLLQLMFNLTTFDKDIEYMLVDLLLKEELKTFDVEKFVGEFDNWIKSINNEEHFKNIGSVLNTLAYKNHKIKKSHYKRIFDIYAQRSKDFGVEIADFAENVQKYALNLIK